MSKERKKALLVTLQDNNIGNRLQNYAMQLILEKFNLKVTNLDNGYSAISIKAEIKDLIRYALSIAGLRKDGAAIFYRKKRYRINKKFTNTYIHNINKVTYSDVYQKNWDSYFIGFVGSDQVWHKWRDDNNELPYYYLEFLPKEKRRWIIE